MKRSACAIDIPTKLIECQNESTCHKKHHIITRYHRIQTIFR